MATAFRVVLTGSQEVPPTPSAASGLGTVLFDDITTTASYSIVVTGLDFGPTFGLPPRTATTEDDVGGAHFHNAPRGTNGPIVFGQVGPRQDNDDLLVTFLPDGSVSLSGVWETTDPANRSIADFASILSTATLGSEVPFYHNVHTTRFPGGEIRGQLVTIATENGEQVFGTDGNDLLPGLGGNDIVVGLGGDDSLIGGFGSDRLEGGDGDDILNDTIGSNQLLGGFGNDQLTGGLEADLMLGEAGDDTLSGSFGNDVLLGGDGIDLLLAGTGNDQVLGEAGDDRLEGSNGRDALAGGDGDDQLLGGPDTIPLTGSPAELLLAQEGDEDLLFGGDGNDQLLGGALSDLLSGGADNDRVDGGAGNDTLYGEAGDDIMIGGAGDDAINGGAGSDLFFFQASFGKDTIFGFAPGLGSEDRIAFSGAGTFRSFAEVQAGATQSGASTVLAFDANNSITLFGVSVASLSADDFLFA